MINWMVSKVQVARKFMPANAAFKLFGDISNSLTSTFENERSLDSAASGGV